MMRYLKLCVSLLAFLALVACGGGGDAPGPGGVSVTGSWSAVVNSGGSGSFSMSLTQDGSSVTGNLMLNGQTQVTGTISGTTLSLSGSDGAGTNYVLSAQVSEATMSGTVNITAPQGTGTLGFTATQAGGPTPPGPGPTPPGPGPTPPGPTPPAPGEVNVTGNWLATLDDGSQFTMNLTQSGTNVTGTLSTDTITLSLSGTVNGSNFNATAGNATITATVSGTTMSGTIVVQTDEGALNSSFTATQQ